MSLSHWLKSITEKLSRRPYLRRRQKRQQTARVERMETRTPPGDITGVGSIFLVQPGQLPNTDIIAEFVATPESTATPEHATGDSAAPAPKQTPKNSERTPISDLQKSTDDTTRQSGGDAEAAPGPGQRPESSNDAWFTSLPSLTNSDWPGSTASIAPSIGAPEIPVSTSHPGPIADAGPLGGTPYTALATPQAAGVQRRNSLDICR